jgi:hypothetical protein
LLHSVSESGFASLIQHWATYILVIVRGIYVDKGR